MTEILQQTDGNINFDIFINGTKIKEVIEVQEIAIEMEVNRITSATIILNDLGVIGVANKPYTNSESADFIPGNEIEISLGYMDKTEKVFKGIIVSHRLKFSGDICQLTVVCKDKAVKMTKGRYNSTFNNKKDSDAFKNIASKYNLNFKMDATTQEYPVLVQYNCSDWDYLVIRAQANNMLVNTYQNKLLIKKNDFSGPANFEINSSQTIIDIDLCLDSENLPESYNMSSWDANIQNNVTTSLKVKDSLKQGNLSAEKLSKIITSSSNDYSSIPIEEEEMKLFLKSQADLAVLQKIQGKITIPGSTKIIAGDLIILSEFSSRFNGKAFISKVTHILKGGNWLTELTVGKSVKLDTSLSEIKNTATPRLIPAIQGTQIAVVKQIVEDSDNNYRVLVTLPSFIGIGQKEGIWARLAIPYATKDAGFFFFPEIDDEVIVTFINNDPRFPVITGSMYNPKNTPAETPNEKNRFKSIYSKSGINITFDDEDSILSIETPSKNTIILDDKNKSVSIKDMNENAIVMNEFGITMKTPKDISLSADGNINLSATSNLAIKAKADATLDGLNITQNAKTTFTAKGNATAELSASGQTTVKGAMVMIN